MIRSHSQPGVDLTYVKQSGESNSDAGDQYTGLDRFGRVVDQRWIKTSSGTATDRFQYGYDRDGNRLWRDNLVNSAFGELYSYDNLNQITSFDRGTLNGTKTGLTGSASRSQDWDFDALGNFDSVTTDSSTQTRSHNEQNEITSISGATTPTYDANGNMTGDETGRKFVFDAWNRLVTVKDSGNNVLESFAYDGVNRRVSATASSTTTDLYYSAEWQVLEERVGGNTTMQYVWSPVYIDAMILRDRDTDANGSLDERLWVQQDANFNVTALLNGSGSVAERYAYDPFGSATVYDASWGTRSSSSYGWVYLHQGRWFDLLSGLYDFRNREYSPTLGRFLSVDPLGFGGSDADLFRAERNSPVMTLDPLGLKGKVYVFAFEGFGGKILGILDPLAKNRWIGQIIVQAIRRAGVQEEYKYFGWLGLGGETAMESTIDKIRNAKGCDPSQIIVVGYSWGAATVTKKVKNVSVNKNYKFRLVYTIDPVTKGRGDVPDFTKNYGALNYALQWINWYQTTDTETLPLLTLGKGVQGNQVDGAENWQVTANDFNAWGRFLSTRNQRWADMFFRQLGAGVRPLGIRPWAGSQDPAHGHTAIIAFPPMLIDLSVKVNTVAKEVKAANDALGMP